MSVKILPSILSSSVLELKSNIDRMVDSGVEALHIDVMDGNFVPPITFGQSLIRELVELWEGILDVHLMVVDPVSFVEQLALNLPEEGRSRIWISFHWEVSSFPVRTAQKIRALGFSKIGVAFNPSTPVEPFLPLKDFFDFVLIMLVEPGYGGQNMMEKVLEKVSVVSNYLPVEVDGGVKADNISAVISKGASLIVSGSYLFPDGEFSEERWEGLLKKL